MPHSTRAHSKIGASSAERWMNCPGSVALCETVPKPADNESAALGTAAHELAEKCLRTGKNAKDFLGQVFNRRFKVDSNMADAVQVYVDHVREVLAETGGELLIEQKFHLSHVHPDLYGTSDVVIRIHFLKLIVMDYKHGEGHVVEVDDNPQLKIYGLGAAFEEGEAGDYGEVELHIIQPRAWHEDGPIRKWSIEFDALVQWAKPLRQKALETEKKNAKIEKGDHCRWCNAAPICPEMRKAAQEIARLDFKTESPKLPPVEKLTDDQIVKVLENQTLITNWFKSVKDFALLRMINGEKINGLKLVKGKSFRQWGDEERTIQKFGPKIYTKKMMTVAQAEKALGKAAVKDFIQTIEGGVTVANESDRRRAVIAAKDDFTKLSFEGEE